MCRCSRPLLIASTKRKSDEMQQNTFQCLQPPILYFLTKSWLDWFFSQNDERVKRIDSLDLQPCGNSSRAWLDGTLISRSTRKEAFDDSELKVVGGDNRKMADWRAQHIWEKKRMPKSRNREYTSPWVQLMCWRLGISLYDESHNEGVVRANLAIVFISLGLT